MDIDVDVAQALACAVSALGGQHRPGQEQMATAVADALDSGGALLVQAGTGTGKSLAYLTPALLHALASDNPDTRGRVVVATATLALQRQLMERDLPRLVDALAEQLGRRPTFAVLKGRHNYVCLDKLNRETNAVLQRPDIREKFTGVAMELIGGTPAHFPPRARGPSTPPSAAVTRG